MLVYEPQKRGKDLSYEENQSFRQFMTYIVNEHEHEGQDSEKEDDFADQLDDTAAQFIKFSFDDKSPSEARPSAIIARIDSNDISTWFMANPLDLTTSHNLIARIFNRNQYRTSKSFGILIDTGCPCSSSGGLDQYRIYCRHVGQHGSIDRTITAFRNFGISGTSSIGVTLIAFPVENVIFKISLYIINSDLHILLSLADMDLLRVHYYNLADKLFNVLTGYFASISRSFYHSFLCWNPFNHFFTGAKLRRLHKRFGHPHTDKL